MADDLKLSRILSDLERALEAARLRPAGSQYDRSYNSGLIDGLRRAVSLVKCAHPQTTVAKTKEGT